MLFICEALPASTDYVHRYYLYKTEDNLYMQENTEFQSAVKILAENLARDGREYELVERISVFYVVIRFIGVFNNRQVIWHARIQTLQNKLKHIRKELKSSTDEYMLKQSIDISEKNDICDVDIALNLKEIDEASIKRTIIMIRKYKRLHLGLHEYGEAISFKQD